MKNVSVRTIMKDVFRVFIVIQKDENMEDEIPDFKDVIKNPGKYEMNENDIEEIRRNEAVLRNRKKQVIDRLEKDNTEIDSINYNKGSKKEIQKNLNKKSR